MTWSLAFLITLPQAFSTNGFFLEGFQVTCTFDYFSTDLQSRIILFYMVIFGYLMPMCLIGLAYIKIYLQVKTKTPILTKAYKESALISHIRFELDFSKNKDSKSKQSIWESSFYKTGNTPIVSRHEKEETDLKKFSRFHQRRNALKTGADLIVTLKQGRKFPLKREIRVAKMVLLKAVIFCAAWSPYVVIIFIAQLAENVDNYITPVTTFLASLSAKSCVICNALVYTLNKKECQKYYNDLFKKLFSVCVRVWPTIKKRKTVNKKLWCPKTH